MASDDLTAAQLAELTGVPAGTLRVWETRHAFPVAHRGPGGRKRYGRADVARIESVLAQRRRGISLAAAIARVKSDPARRVPSVFAALRASRPDLQVQLLSKPVLTALSRAIEDEFSSRAAGGLLGGCFQRERHYRASERRWRRLARTADIAIAVADFPETRLHTGGPVEVSLGSAHPLEREWSVIVNAPSLTACLAACELEEPSGVRDSERRFETLWSFDPAVAVEATRALRQILEQVAPEIAADIPPELTDEPPTPSTELRLGAELSMRAVSYVAADMSRGHS